MTMRAATLIALTVCAGLAAARLPAPADPAKAQAQALEASAKTAWTDKVTAFKLCQAQDRAAEAYRKNVSTMGKPGPSPMPTPPCADPGPYVSPVTPEASKPLEASGAHSPAGTAQSPPSNKATSAEMSGGTKKNNQ